MSMDAKADVTAGRTRSVTPLIIASVTDCAQVQRLLDGGAHVNASDNYGESALIWAARLGKTDCARLLNAKADLGAQDRRYREKLR